MRSSSLLLVVLCSACAPIEVPFSSSPGGDVPPEQSVPFDPVYLHAVLDAGDVVACDAPDRRALRGPYTRLFSELPSNRPGSNLPSAGVIAGDLDEDGFVDLVAPTEPFAVLFRGRRGGKMVQLDQLESFDLTEGVGGSVADFDGDTDLDLLVLRYNAPDVLLRNDGGGALTDVSAAVGLSTDDSPSTSSSWADMDGDGDLDLFIGADGDTATGQAAPSYLYENQGDGTFADRSHTLPARAHAGLTRVGGFHDINADGFPELYLVNDVGAVEPNVLLMNWGGILAEDEIGRGLDLPTSGSGLGVGDVDGDGLPDFLIPQWGRVTLLQSRPDERWVDHASSLGLAPRGDQEIGWGAELADVDNDGDLDAAIAFGHFEQDGLGWDNPELQPDALFLQQDDGSFVDVAPEWGVDDTGVGRGFVVVDVNDDGWLDLVKRELGGQNVVYRSRCGTQGWLKVSLSDPYTQNVHAVGAVVTVRAGDEVWTRTVLAGGTGFGSGGPPELHIGLGEHHSVDEIEVRWPDGSRSLLDGLPAHRQVTIRRAEK